MTNATLTRQPITDQPDARTGPAAGTCTEPGASRGMLSAPGLLPTGQLKAITCLDCGRLYIEGGLISRTAVRAGGMDWCTDRCHARWAATHMKAAS